jgi:hypothetical protein
MGDILVLYAISVNELLSPKKECPLNRLLLKNIHQVDQVA